MQKYRADKSELQSDNAIVWRALWIGGPSLSRINNCRAINLSGEPRLTAYVTGEADTYFSITAKAWYLGKRINGYLTTDDETGCIVFHHCYY